MGRASTDLCNLLFLFPLLLILQALLLLPGDHLREAIVIGAGLGVLCGGDLWVIVDDDDTYGWQKDTKKVSETFNNQCSAETQSERIIFERE